MTKRGWFREPARHSLSARGLKTRFKKAVRDIPFKSAGRIAVDIRDIPQWAKDAIYEYAESDRVRPHITIEVREKVSVYGEKGEGHYLYDEVTGKVASLRSGYSEDIISSPKEQQMLAFGPEAPLKPGQQYLVVSHYYSGGEYYAATLYVNPADAPRFLPAPTGLTKDEKILLKATSGLKSSYAGIRDYRAHEAKREGLEGDVEAVRASLRAKGLIDKRNAITVKGRNALYGAGEEY